MARVTEHAPRVILLAAVGLAAARRARGLPEQMKLDGLGAWRMDRWCADIVAWLAGDEDARGEPEARAAVLAVASLLTASPAP